MTDAKPEADASLLNARPEAVGKPTKKFACKARSRLTNGKSVFHNNVDQRTTLARRFRDLIAMYTTELGGAEKLPPAKQQMIRSVAALQIQCEVAEGRMAAGATSSDDLLSYATGVNALRRQLQMLGFINEPAPAADDGTVTVIGGMAGIREAIKDEKERRAGKKPVGPQGTAGLRADIEKTKAFMASQSSLDEPADDSSIKPLPRPTIPQRPAPSPYKPPTPRPPTPRPEAAPAKKPAAKYDWADL